MWLMRSVKGNVLMLTCYLPMLMPRIYNFCALTGFLYTAPPAPAYSLKPLASDPLYADFRCITVAAA